MSNLELKAKPISFAAPMVRAILDGSKTQMRRSRNLPRAFREGPMPELFVPLFLEHSLPWRVGDQLWVRETWAHDASDLDTCRREVYYKATAIDAPPCGWRSPNQMPHWASRITLLVTEVRVECLQDISEADARAEGGPSCTIGDDGKFYADPTRGTHRIGFAGLWDHIYGSGAWDAAPWVMVIKFNREESQR